MQTPHRILRTHAKFSNPSIEINAIMQDNVLIRGTWLQRGHSKVIIILNAAMRSRHQFGVVLLSEWLSKKYDIMAFDTRGHFESGGCWNTGERFIWDVRDLILFAKNKGYDKVGLCGRSASGWAAIITACRFGIPDSVVSISPPIDRLTLQPIYAPLVKFATKGLFLSLIKWLVYFISNVKLGQIDTSLSLREEISKPSSVPIFFIFHEADPILGIGEVEAKNLYRLAKFPKKLLIIRSTGHGMELESFREIAEKIEQWYEKTL